MQAFFHTAHKSTWLVRIQLGRLVGIRINRLVVFFYLFAVAYSGTFRKCSRCSWNPMQWSKCFYCYNCIELWLRISSQANSVCFGGTPGSHSRNPGWKSMT